MISYEQLKPLTEQPSDVRAELATSLALPSAGRLRCTSIARSLRWHATVHAEPAQDVLLIDVREPDEVMYGSIPSSVNLPLSQLEKAMKLEDGRFQKQFAFAKPSKAQDIIVYCKAGVRAASAIKYLQEKGYKKCASISVSQLTAQRRQLPRFVRRLAEARAGGAMSGLLQCTRSCIIAAQRRRQSICDSRS